MIFFEPRPPPFRIGLALGIVLFGRNQRPQPRRQFAGRYVGFRVHPEPLFHERQNST